MANKHILTLVILGLINSSIQDSTNNIIDSNDESPLSDIAKEILNEKNLQNIGGMVNSFIQSGGAKTIMDGVLQNLGNKENSGQLLESLGNLLSNDKKSTDAKDNDQINPMELISGLGSLMGAMQGAGGDNAQPNPAALLQGLGSLLGIANNGEGNGADALIQGIGSLMAGSQGNNEGGLNPELIGSMINMFANTQEAEKKPAKQTKSKTPNKAKSIKVKKDETKKPKHANTSSIKDLISLGMTILGSEGSESNIVNIIFENLPLVVKAARFFSRGKSEKYIDILDDVTFIYEEVKNTEKGQINFSKLLPKFLRIYKGYKELIDPYTKSAGDKNPDSFDINTLINLASLFGNKGGNSNFMDFLPMIVNTFSAFTGNDAEQRAKSHSGHAGAIPPVLEKIHIFFDNFMSSDMGKSLIRYFGGQKILKVFQDEHGNFDFDKFKELIENHSFRRHWIEQLTNRLVSFLTLILNEDIQNQYINMGISFGNSFLKSLGFPSEALINLSNPVNSISNFASYVAKNYLHISIDTKVYVEPVVQFLREILKMARNSVNLKSEPKELTEKLTDTINMDIIEPFTRVNRAYRFVKAQPYCDRYVFCILNQEEPPYGPDSLPFLRKALYKGYSLIAGWFLTSYTGTSYWDLYTVITEKRNCQKCYDDRCNGFYHEDIKATTEYIHNEL